MVSLTDVELSEVMGILGIVPEDFLAVKRARTHEEAQEVLRVLKVKAHRGFRKAALKLHPDHNDGDEAKTRLFIRAKEIVDYIEKTRLRPPPRVVRRSPPMHVQVIMHGVGFARNASTTTTPTTMPGGVIYTIQYR